MSAGMVKTSATELSVLDLLMSAVLLLDAEGNIAHCNAAAEDVFGLSRRQLLGQSVGRLFDDVELLQESLQQAREDRFSHKTLPLTVSRIGLPPLLLSGAVVVLHGQPWPVLLELRETQVRERIERAEEQLEHADANLELLRNLAHEVKNPLGGLRGAAQLLEGELNDPRLTEYTQVIIAEADRLHALVDRLLAPHRTPRVPTQLNIHEVCERVVALVMAEYGAGLTLVRDYDISVPELMADREQLIQALLNIVRNAAQVLAAQRRTGQAEIIVRTRVARQVTLARQRHPLVLALHVIDNGPGIPENIRDRVFLPLVSGRDGGTGLGLSLVQAIILRHGGAIDFDSRPGRTEFRLLLPLNSSD